MLVRGRDEVRVLTVLSYEEYPYVLVPGEHLSDEGERAEQARQHVGRVTAPAREIFDAAGLSVTVAHRFGNPGDEIINDIGEWGPDLVVMGHRGVRGLDRWLGSVSEHVLHHAKVPVLLVP
jgi:nucleotide-binding universal stress UspA family protein